MWESVTLESVAKAVAYLATLGYSGAVTAAALARPSRAASLPVLCARVARVTAIAGLVALVGRAWFHASTVADGVVDRDTLARVVLDSRWGGRWQWQFAAAASALALAALRSLARGDWRGPALAALAWTVATPLLGHGAVTPWQHATHALHVGVAGAWLGTVGVLALAATREGELMPVVVRFSPFALACAALAAASGTVLAVAYVGTLDELTGSAYGRWLIVKLGAVAGTGLCGALNWRRVSGGQPPASGLLRCEALCAVLIAIVTAALTETAHPSP